MWERSESVMIFRDFGWDFFILTNEEGRRKSPILGMGHMEGRMSHYF